MVEYDKGILTFYCGAGIILMILKMLTLIQKFKTYCLVSNLAKNTWNKYKTQIAEHGMVIMAYLKPKVKLLAEKTADYTKLVINLLLRNYAKIFTEYAEKNLALANPNDMEDQLIYRASIAATQCSCIFFDIKTVQLETQSSITETSECTFKSVAANSTADSFLSYDDNEENDSGLAHSNEMNKQIFHISDSSAIDNLSAVKSFKNLNNTNDFTSEPAGCSTNVEHEEVGWENNSIKDTETERLGIVKEVEADIENKTNIEIQEKGEQIYESHFEMKLNKSNVEEEMWNKDREVLLSTANIKNISLDEMLNKFSDMQFKNDEFKSINLKIKENIVETQPLTTSFITSEVDLGREKERKKNIEIETNSKKRNKTCLEVEPIILVGEGKMPWNSSELYLTNRKGKDTHLEQTLHKSHEMHLINGKEKETNFEEVLNKSHEKHLTKDKEEDTFLEQMLRKVHEMHLTIGKVKDTNFEEVLNKSHDEKSLTNDKEKKNFIGQMLLKSHEKHLTNGNEKDNNFEEVLNKSHEGPLTNDKEKDTFLEQMLRNSYETHLTNGKEKVQSELHVKHLTNDKEEDTNLEQMLRKSYEIDLTFDKGKDTNLDEKDINLAEMQNKYPDMQLKQDKVKNPNSVPLTKDKEKDTNFEQMLRKSYEIDLTIDMEKDINLEEKDTNLAGIQKKSSDMQLKQDNVKNPNLVPEVGIVQTKSIPIALDSSKTVKKENTSAMVQNNCVSENQKATSAMENMNFITNNYQKTHSTNNNNNLNMKTNDLKACMYKNFFSNNSHFSGNVTIKDVNNNHTTSTINHSNVSTATRTKKASNILIEPIAAKISNIFSNQRTKKNLYSNLANPITQIKPITKTTSANTSKQSKSRKKATSVTFHEDSIKATKKLKKTNTEPNLKRVLHRRSSQSCGDIFNEPSESQNTTTQNGDNFLKPHTKKNRTTSDCVSTNSYHYFLDQACGYNNNYANFCGGFHYTPSNLQKYSTTGTSFIKTYCGHSAADTGGSMPSSSCKSTESKQHVNRPQQHNSDSTAHSHQHNVSPQWVNDFHFQRWY